MSVIEVAALRSRPGLHSRSFDMLNQFFFVENPLLPLRAAIGHTSKNDFGNLQARIAEADCAGDKKLKSQHDSLTRTSERSVPYVMFLFGLDIVRRGWNGRQRMWCITRFYMPILRLPGDLLHRLRIQCSVPDRWEIHLSKAYRLLTPSTMFVTVP